MSRIYEQSSLEILQTVAAQPGINSRKLFALTMREQGQPYKTFYNTIYRLIQQGLLERKDKLEGLCVWLTEHGRQTLCRRKPERDGVWKMVIFDIPEKQKYVRAVLRAKLKSLHFKKWQNSIWISPYALDAEIEQDLNELAEKFFVRLVRISQINSIKDLEKMFP